MKRTGIALITAVFVAQLAFAQQNQAGQNQTTGTALTIYNQDLAVARTTVDLDLKQGTNEITTTKVTRQLEPDSVVLRDPKGSRVVNILEQNYDAAVVDQDALLRQFEGQTIDFQNLLYRSDQEGQKLVTTRGKIVRAPSAGVSPIIEVDGKLQFQLPGTPIFATTSESLLLKPTLRWQIFADAPAHFSAELSYLTHGFNWNATYNIVATGEAAATSGEESMDLIGWVTISNNSGTDFTDTKVKLMAGNVATAPPPPKAMFRAMAVSQTVAVESGPVTQKSFDDFHLYDLNRQVTLKDRETKQIEFLSASKIPVLRKYVYDGAQSIPIGIAEGSAFTQNEYGLTNSKQVRVEQEFVNSKKNHLGIPLPAGIMRFYRQDSDGQMEFVGENSINHTPEDEKVHLTTGTAFDVTGERKRTRFFVDSSRRTIDESYSITVKNAKDKPVNVEVLEHLFRAANWDIVEKSTSFDQRDSSTIVFPVTISAHGQQTVTYTVHYTW